MTLNELFGILRKRIVPVVLIPVFLACVTALISYAFLSDIYTADTTLYVLNRQSKSTVIETSDLATSLSLVSDYKKLITSRTVTQAASARVAMPDLSAFNIEVSADSGTRLIDISVSGNEKDKVVDVANTLADEFSKVVVKIMNAENVSIVDPAYVDTAPSGPPRVLYIILAAFIGVLLSVGIAIGIESLSTTVGSPQEVEKMFGLPVLGRVSAYKRKRGK